jgi:hypothetical protein
VLAIERQPVGIATIGEELAPGAAKTAAIEALEALRHRSLVERSDVGPAFTLQSVVLEYVTERLVQAAATEIETGQLTILRNRPLVKGQAKDYVRQAQERLIAEPLLDQLIGSSEGRALAERALLRCLERERNVAMETHGFGPGNLVNLLRLLRGNLRGTNASRLRIQQAYLQDVEAQDASLAGTQLLDSVLGDAFGAVGSVAISAGAGVVAAGMLGGAVRVWRMVDRAPMLSTRGYQRRWTDDCQWWL